MPDVLREPTAAHGHAPARSVLSAAGALVAHRHAQRASPTFGDQADEEILRALVGAPTREAREAGALIGREILARRCFEDSIPGAVAILSTSMLASGWGTLSLADWLHRSGALTFRPAPAAQAAHAALPAFVEGALEGYLSHAFNCRASALHVGAWRFEASLHEGRNVNQEARRA